MNWYTMFYWLSVGDSVVSAAAVVSILSGIFFIINTIAILCGGYGGTWNEQDRKEKAATLPLAKKMRNWSLFIFFFLGSIAILCPTKKDMLMIIAGGAVGNFITSDTSARDIPGDVAKYLHTALQGEIKGLSEEARAEIGLQTEEDKKKHKLIDKVKDMSKEEMIKYLKQEDISLK